MISQWFNDSKQSLAVAGPICTEANGLVQSSRKQIEKAGTLWAQTLFLHDAITEQLGMLRNVQDSILAFRNGIEKELDQVSGNLEETHKRLKSSLDRLEHTVLDEAFSGDNKKKTLRSFVFEDGISDLQTAIRAETNKANRDQSALAESIQKLSQDIDDLTKKAPKRDELSARKGGYGIEEAHESTDIVAEHAHAMALLLESLTKHYDQCLQAMESENEKTELIEILEQDSHEVPEVVNELYERSRSMKNSAQTVLQFKSQIEQAHRQVVKYFHVLDDFATIRLPQYLDMFDGYSREQKQHISQLITKTGEVSSLVDYYQMFFKSYQAMVLEVLRRSRAENNLQSMADDMAVQLKRAHEEEMKLRQQFVQERGDYLPSDLWAGLTDPLDEPHVEFKKSRQPLTLSEATIQAAVKFA